MVDFSQARKNMVDCQIHTNGVIMQDVLNAFEITPRELFVPEAYQKMACNDEDIPLGAGRYILEPSVHARMIQALNPKSEDVVLDIAGGTGYSAAILSVLVSTVVVLEDQPEMLEKATNIWNANDLCNIAAFEGPLDEGSAENAPYDSILINGALSEVPQKILDQLAVGGQLVCVLKEPGDVMGQAHLFQKGEDGQCSSCALFDAATPYLSGFEPKPVFQF